MQIAPEFTQDVNIKSKYLNSAQPRQIVVSPAKEQISISHAGQPSKFKDFHIDELEKQQFKGNKVVLKFDSGREYEVETRQPQRLQMALQHTRNMQLSSKFNEQHVRCVPHIVNYSTAMKSMLDLLMKDPSQPQNQHLDMQKASQTKPTEIEPTKEKPTKPERQYECLPYFKDPEDWKVNDQGHLVILNEKWISNASKIVGFLVKKFLTTGNFMGLSFPVFAMQPESILQTYAKSLAAAPKIFSGTFDPVERMKEFVSFMWTVSIAHVTLLKPFNPVIGETFQADIGGGQYSAEQVSHHPPVSSFLYCKDNYRIHGSLQLSASIGLNSGEGRFLGDICIEYQDGHWIKGRLPSGELTGVIFGETKFRCYGAAYVYDSNNLVLTYELNSSDIFEGYLGVLHFKSSKHFKEEVLKSPDRYVKFKPYSEHQYSKILHTFQGKYASWLAFDRQYFFNFDDPKMHPYILQAPLDEYVLQSDSRYRKDTQYLKNGKTQESQEEKERLQNEQRANRKLREAKK